MDPSTVYIWRKPGWPAFTLHQEALIEPLGRARLAQGTALGLAHALGLERHPEVIQNIWIADAMATAGIEGEKLDVEAVRSSVLRKMGLAATRKSPRHVDGLIEVMDDATRNFAGPLTHARLCNWQAALFPGGRSGLARIEVGKYRTYLEPMQIVSGRIGKEKIHYVAPPSAQVHSEMTHLLAWFRDSAPGGKTRMDGLVRMAIAHLWFEAIHPFKDGNGRIGRALCDMALAQDANAASRIASLSRQLHENRSQYYDQLITAQRGGLDVTDWVVWFVAQFEEACKKSAAIIRAAVDRAHFWEAAPKMNGRQKKVVQKLIDAGRGGFEGGMSAGKYVNMTGASKATATRDLADLSEKGVLEIAGQGRGTRYWIAGNGPRKT
ncbi:MAG: Fic family protein [Betaproteobacteria bacterium]|nr:Fic family protein [Betaproteobacteria bacterium]